ncbi:GAF domain-containing protein [Lentzea sp. HUAS TT2]|uniref:GAF domain-containing protein n=1 Tax=Lentzea sp. HUAS TT2 TaxID=3447454 RepID=UPI003F7106D8
MDTRSELRKAHELFVCAETVLPFVRPVVASSWRRCALARAGSDDRRLPATWMGAAELADYRMRHPLGSVLPVFDALLGGSIDDGGHLFAVSDANGVLLRVRGRTAALDRAGRMNFAEGANWSESSAGTNAPGTALAVGHPVRVFSAEHYNEVVHPWSCSAALVRDPHTGRVLGAVDVTGDETAASPYALALVRAAAAAAEAELLGRRARPRPGAAIRALGRDEALLEVDGRVRRLSRRHSEILVVLVLARAGRTAGRLAVELSDAELGTSTVRAEMSRLRAVLGDRLLGSRPYELREEVSADFGDLGALLAEGRVHDAMALYDGPLLPSSDAPLVREHRESLEQQLRGAVLAGGDVRLLRRWVDTGWGSTDGVVWQALSRHLPKGSAAGAAAAARARGLLGSAG